MLTDQPPKDRLARLFALHRTEDVAQEEPLLPVQRDTALTDEQIAQWQAAAVASLRR